MIKRIALLIAIVLLLIPGSIVMASDITDAGYAGIIRVSNNSTETQNVAVPVTGVNSTNLINAGFLASNASDCTIRQSGSDIPFMPGYALNPWCLWVTDIGTSTYYSDVLYTPNVTGGEIRYFPDTTGMTISDDASLEVGDNFTITMNNIYPNTDTGTNKNIIRKDDTFYTYADNVTAGKVHVRLPRHDLTATLTPDGAGSLTELTAFGAATNWQAVLTNDGDTSYSLSTTAALKSDLYTLSAPARMQGTITNVTTYVVIKSNLVASGSGSTFIKTNGSTYSGAGVALTANYESRSTSYDNNPNTGIAWTWSEIENLEAGVSLTYNAPYEARCTQVYAVVTYHYPEVDLTLTGIDAAEKSAVVVSANTTHLTINIAGTTNSTALNGNMVVDNANDWIFFENDSVMYASKTVFEINGVNITSIEWEYDSIFHDSIGSNDATPSFRTVSSDADVSAELIEFLPISESTAPAYSVTEAEPFLTTTPTISSDFTTDSSNSTLPGSEVISETATAGGTPVSLPFTILGCFGLLTVSFTASYLTKKSGSASIWPKMLCVGIAAGLLVGVKVFDFWMITYLLMMIVAFSMAKTHATWGGEAGYNVVGFLAMSFVGMTIINRVMEGVFINSTDVGILNNVLVFRPVNVFGLFQISVPNLDFLSTGIPHLMKWDYSFFGGNAVIIQYMFYSITAFVAFLLFVLMLGVVFNMLSRNR